MWKRVQLNISNSLSSPMAEDGFIYGPRSKRMEEFGISCFPVVSAILFLASFACWNMDELELKQSH